jgi:hypothetical protein
MNQLSLQVTCSKCRRFVEGDTKFKKNEKVHSLRFNMACECSDSIVEFQQSMTMLSCRPHLANR